MAPPSLKNLLGKGTVVLPGAFNALSALLIEDAGFSACYLSGAGLANAVFGRPDIGLTTLDEAVQHAVRITAAITIPTLCDADTGFGGPQEVATAVRRFEAAGIAGIHLEDQHEDKRCGHLDGKQLVAPEAMAEKIRAAVAGRTRSDFLIMARTDARAALGLDGAIARARQYVAAGADAIFPEALTSVAELKAFRQAIDVPLLANMTEFGKTPYLSVKEFENLGYDLVIFPMTLFRIAAGAMREALVEIKRTGTQRALLEKMQTRQALYILLKYDPR